MESRWTITPKINTDVLDGDGNLRAADIGITWADNETFLHGVRIVGSKFPRPTGHEPKPYPERGNDGQVTPSMTGRPSSPETIEFGPEIITVNRPAAEQLHRPATESRQGYRPAAPNSAIQQQVVELASVVPSLPRCC